MPDKTSTSISSRRDAFADASKWFEELLVSRNVPESAKWDLLLVFEEVVVNVIDYAYAERDDGTIDLSVEISDESLTLTVRDEGPPFDPLSNPDPDLDPTGPRAIGGLGVHLVKSLCDEARYQRIDESNILSVTKHLN